MPIYRFATFNVENLFGRAKVLNFYKNETGDDKLKIIADLQTELERDVYDKPEIIQLYEQVKDYIKFNVLKSTVGHRIVYMYHGNYRVAPNGKDDWFGFIEYKLDKFDDQTQKNTARVIREIDADVICLIEIENRPVLTKFNSERLYRDYPYNMLIDGNDPRGIDVSILSELELGRVRTNIFDGPANSRTFSRDCLEVEIKTQAGQSIYFLVNHFKSKSGWDQNYNDQRRLRQTTRIAEILQERYDLTTQFVVVAGDFNDTPGNAPLNPLISNPNLHDVLNEKYGNNHQECWTYHYQQNEQIDYILVSTQLQQAFVDAGVERRGMYDVAANSNGTIQPFNSVTNWRNAASDHGAVWADFDL